MLRFRLRLELGLEDKVRLRFISGVCLGQNRSTWPAFIVTTFVSSLELMNPDFGDKLETNWRQLGQKWDS